jgi:hypothetical protein
MLVEPDIVNKEIVLVPVPDVMWPVPKAVEQFIVAVAE